MNLEKATAYNAKVQIMPELKEHLSLYWPSNKESSDFARIAARFQKAAGLSVDGCFGPNTQRRLVEENIKPRPENYIIVDGIRHAVDFKVVTYEQEPFWSAYPAKHFRWRDCDVDAFVLHWDVTLSSESTHKVLSKKDRTASVHFCGGEDGTIYQCFDAGFVRAWHAGSNGKINARSVGIEINNPWYVK